MKREYVLVVNCGSSSIKFQIIHPHYGQTVCKGIVENLATARCTLRWNGETKQLNSSNDCSVFEELFSAIQPWEKELIAVGHRVVHGGEQIFSATMIDDQIIKVIETCSAFAPLHNPLNLKGICKFQQHFPQLPQVAVFDTAFHHSLPPHAYLYGIPYVYYQRYQIRRYGFHGMSHRYVTQKASAVLNTPIETLGLISVHLGNGCSVSAVLGGKSVDTSMGMTPLEGLMMGQRSGDVDPGALAYLMEKERLTPEEIHHILNCESGLLGVSGLNKDMRIIEQEIDKGNQRAKIAFDLFCYRAAKSIASYFVPLPKVHGIIFTGGIGENSCRVRGSIIRWLQGCHLLLDEERNTNHGLGSCYLISPENYSPSVLVIPTNEELNIAEETIKIIEREVK